MEMKPGLPKYAWGYTLRPPEQGYVLPIVSSVQGPCITVVYIVPEVNVRI